MANSALVLIDLQKAFINKHTEGVVDKIKKLVESNKFEHIIATKFINSIDSQFVKLGVYEGCMNEDETQLINEIDFSKAMVIERCLYTGVTNKFLEYANENNITEFYIAGLDTDACVMKTAMDLFEYDFTPYIIADCCASSGGEKYHLEALDLLKRNIGKNQII